MSIWIDPDWEIEYLPQRLALVKVMERSVPAGVLTLLRVLPHFHVRWGIGGHCPARVADVQLRTWLVWASTRYTSEGRNIDLLGNAIEILEKKNFLRDSQLSSSPYGLSTSYWSSISSSGSWGELLKWCSYPSTFHLRLASSSGSWGNRFDGC